MQINLNRPYRSAPQNLGFWEALVGAVITGLTSDSGGGNGAQNTSGGSSTPGNMNNLFTQIAPTIQTQISPNISPVFQQVQSGGSGKPGESGSAPITLNASTEQTAPATFTAAPSMDIRQSMPGRVTPAPDYVDPQNYQVAPTIQTQIPAQNSVDKFAPWILGGLALIVVVKMVR